MSQRNGQGGEAWSDAPAIDQARAPGRSTASGRLFPGAMLLRKAQAAGGVAANADQAVASASSSSGSALPEAVRGRFESSLGSDLSSVRVHTGGASEDAAYAVGAKAYTVGNDIHFGAGQYAPADPFGIHLLAHEVAHTQQQAGGVSRRAQFKLDLSAPGDAHEVEADRAADAMTSGAPAQISGMASGVVSRKVDLAIARLRFKKEFLPRANGDKEQAKQLYMKELGGPANWDDAIMEDDTPKPAPAPAPAPSAPVPQPSPDEVDDIIEKGEANGGVVTREVPKDGDSPVLPVGTYVQKLGPGAKDATLSVYAFSDINRKRDMDSDSFKAEPSLRHSGKSKKNPHDAMDHATYQQSKKPLWGPDGPQPDDAMEQHDSGDCYFLSAVGAVCQSNQAAITKLFNPQTPAPSYTITLYKKQGDAAPAPISFNVDTFIPTAPDGSLNYAGAATDVGIWVSLLEKAWAMYVGSYDNMGGGWSASSHPGPALEALTGNASGKVSPDSLFTIARLQALATANRAVTVGIGDETDTNKAVFAEFGMHEDHQYLFVGMAGDAAVLKNPWGYDHPTKPLTDAAIRAIVDDISYAAVDGAPSHDPYNKDCQDATGSDAPECSMGGGGGVSPAPRPDDGAGGAGSQ